MKLTMPIKGISYEEARAEIANSIAARRFGRPEEFGDACAYLCSAQAGFISGSSSSSTAGLIEDSFDECVRCLRESSA